MDHLLGSVRGGIVVFTGGGVDELLQARKVGQAVCELLISEGSGLCGKAGNPIVVALAFRVGSSAYFEGILTVREKVVVQLSQSF